MDSMAHGRKIDDDAPQGRPKTVLLRNMGAVSRLGDMNVIGTGTLRDLVVLAISHSEGELWRYVIETERLAPLGCLDIRFLADAYGILDAGPGRGVLKTTD